jgi:hypothetical protein
LDRIGGQAVDYDHEDIYQPDDPYRDEHGFNYAVKRITYLDFLREALTFHEFEAEHWTEYAVIPWYLLRWMFALIWTVIWGNWRAIRNRGEDFYPAWAFAWGRHDSPEPVVCPRCLWAGPRRWLYHGYGSCGDDDVEPVDECPKCGAEL